MATLERHAKVWPRAFEKFGGAGGESHVGHEVGG